MIVYGLLPFYKKFYEIDLKNITVLNYHSPTKAFRYWIHTKVPLEIGDLVIGFKDSINSKVKYKVIKFNYLKDGEKLFQNLWDNLNCEKMIAAVKVNNPQS